MPVRSLTAPVSVVELANHGDEEIHAGSALSVPVFYTGSETLRSSSSFKTKNR